MRNKRGQFFSFLLLIITIVMCLLSYGIYVKQQGEVSSSLVSPLAVLELRDAKEVFELREQELILDSLDDVKGEFGSEEFLKNLRGRFILGISEDMKDFIFSNLVWEDKVLERGEIEDSFLKNIVYGESLFSRVDSSKIYFNRGKIGKGFVLMAEDKEKTNFQVDFDFDFGGKYLISKIGGGYKVEVVE